MRLQPRCRVTAAGLFLLSGLPSQSRFRNDGEGEDADRKDIFMFKWIKKHYEVLSYLIFGVLTTLLNILLYALFNRLFGYTAANSWGNVLDNILCILFAYATNRAFVFNSKTRGRAMAKEFGAFVTCRLGTMLLDTAIMLVLGNLLAAQGAALMDELMQGVLSVVAHWLGPDTAIQMAAPMQAHRRGSRMALPLLPSSAVQTAPRQSLSLPSTIRRSCGVCASRCSPTWWLWC